MINYKIGDLVNRINIMYSKLSDGAPLVPSGSSNLKGIEVPYTKDNFQIICQLIKLGILQDPLADTPSLGSQPFGDEHPTISQPSGHYHSESIKGGDFGVCHVKFNQMFLGFFPILAPKGQGEEKAPKLANSTNANIRKNTKKNLLTLVSKPGRKIFISYKDLKDLNSGFKLYILRTSQGIITSQTALKNKIGGEVLFKISFA